MRNLSAIKTLGALGFLLALPACQQSMGQPVERLAFEAVSAGPSVQASPDIHGAVWSPLASAQGVQFGKAGAAPLFSLACEAGAQMRVIRYAPAEPGARALFALVGHGRVLRVKTDAVRHDGGWRWEGAVPAEDIHLDVFAGAGPVEGTLPGAGTLKLAASPEPSRLLQACRQMARDSSGAAPQA